MPESMRTFRTDVSLENVLAPRARRHISGALVDRGAALSWFPRDILDSIGVRPLKLWRFRQADGTLLERWSAEVRA